MRHCESLKRFVSKSVCLARKLASEGDPAICSPSCEFRAKKPLTKRFVAGLPQKPQRRKVTAWQCKTCGCRNGRSVKNCLLCGRPASSKEGAPDA